MRVVVDSGFALNAGAHLPVAQANGIQTDWQQCACAQPTGFVEASENHEDCPARYSVDVLYGKSPF
jgi:hypothetical protein